MCKRWSCHFGSFGFLLFFRVVVVADKIVYNYINSTNIIERRGIRDADVEEKKKKTNQQNSRRRLIVTDTALRLDYSTCFFVVSFCLKWCHFPPMYYDDSLLNFVYNFLFVIINMIWIEFRSNLKSMNDTFEFNLILVQDRHLFYTWIWYWLVCYECRYWTSVTLSCSISTRLSTIYGQYISTYGRQYLLSGIARRRHGRRL